MEEVELTQQTSNAENHRDKSVEDHSYGKPTDPEDAMTDTNDTETLPKFEFFLSGDFRKEYGESEKWAKYEEVSSELRDQVTVSNESIRRHWVLTPSHFDLRSFFFRYPILLRQMFQYSIVHSQLNV